MNPMSVLKLKPLVEAFRTNHPKVPAFFSAAASSVNVGSVVEVKVTTAEGKEIISNIKVTEQDVELLNELRGLMTEQ